MNFLPLIQIGPFSPLIQILIVCILFLGIVWVQYKVFQKIGTFSHNYPPITLTLFAPIYEEVLFRGIFLSGLISMYGIKCAIVVTSVLFGIWHIRSIFFMPKKKVFSQIIYTGLVLGPIFALITIITGSIWIAVILHFLNNLFAPIAEHKKFFYNK
jgi:membrane protease YdiL (CAAX protease family)